MNGAAEPCTICFARNCHVCLVCGNKYNSIDLCEAHQRNRSHFSGHFLLSDASRQVRLPTRYDDGAPDANSADAENSDAAAAAQFDAEVDAGLVAQLDRADVVRDADADQLNDNADAAIVPIDVVGAAAAVDVRDFAAIRNEQVAERKRKVRGDIDENDNADMPKWAARVLENHPDLSFNDTFTAFKCPCDLSKWLAVSNSGASNVNKHMNKCRIRGRADQQQAHLDEHARVVPPLVLSQSSFETRLVAATLSAALPFSWIENSDVKELLLHLGRGAVTVPSRRTLVRRADQQFEETQLIVRKTLAAAKSKISLTFDCWTDRVSRSFIAVTAHFFDDKFILRSLLLDFVHLPFTERGNTGERVRDELRHALRRELPDHESKLGFLVTDNGSNVVKAAILLARETNSVARRCLQHNLQLFLKHLCAGEATLASPIASANYIARLAKTSSSFHHAVGTIPVGVITRWNSFIESAAKVVLKRDDIIAYHRQLPRNSNQAPMLEPHLLQLENFGGFTSLRDMVVLLEPLMSITIEQEGEYYVTSSAVVPKLVRAKQTIDHILNCVGVRNNVNGTIANCQVVFSWKPKIDELWATYVDGFVSDKVFLSAMWLDARNRCGFGLPRDVTDKAIAALKEMMTAARAFLIAAHRAVAAAAPVLPPPQPAAAVADDSPLAHLRNMGLHVPEVAALAPVQAAPLELQLDSVDDEFNKVSVKLATVDLPRDHSKFNPMSVFAGGEFPIACRVALDVLSVPAGEAPSERIFSIAGRVITADRAQLTPDQLARATYVIKNRKALKH
jgi:hypothetical protein